MATVPLIIIYLTCLVCMQSMEIMQLENLQQVLLNKKPRDEYMACSKSVDSSNLIWVLFSDFENPRESASRTVDLTKKQTIQGTSQMWNNVFFLLFSDIFNFYFIFTYCVSTQKNTKHTHAIYKPEVKTLLTHFLVGKGGKLGRGKRRMDLF